MSFDRWPSAGFAALCAVLLVAMALFPLRVAMADPVLPKRIGAVTDEADILSDGDERSLTSWAEQTKQKSGTELVVVTLLSLQHQPIEVWGRALGRTWRVGGNSANGVILIVAPYDREVRIEIGDGVNELTNSMADSIIQGIILPKFRDRRLAAGTAAGVFAIADALTPGTYVAPSPPQVERAPRPNTQDLEEEPSWKKPQTVGFAVIVIVVFLGLMLLYVVYRTMRDMFSRSASSEGELLLDQEVRGPDAPVNYNSVVTHSRTSRHTGVKFGGVRSFWGSSGATGSGGSRRSGGSGGFSGSRGSSGSWGSSGRSSGGGFGGRGSSGKW